MTIGGSLPFNIARAYGVMQPQKTATVQPVAQPSPAKPVDQLIAGRTNQPISFDGHTVGQSSGTGALQLYTRAADRIEAAVGVELGKTLDVKG